MRKGLLLLAASVVFILGGQPVESQEVSSLGRYVYRAFVRIAYSHLERFAGLLDPSGLRFLADGGEAKRDASPTSPRSPTRRHADTASFVVAASPPL